MHDDIAVRPAGAAQIRRGGRGRSMRVMVLLGGVVILSLGDLLLTLAHLRSTGMMEANPIAVYLIKSTQSAWVLVAYKALTVGVCVALLYRLRRHVQAEIGAWCAVALLAFMSVNWYGYVRLLDDNPELFRLAQAGAFEDDWLFLDPRRPVR